MMRTYHARYQDPTQRVPYQRHRIASCIEGICRFGRHQDHQGQVMVQFIAWFMTEPQRKFPPCIWFKPQYGTMVKQLDRIPQDDCCGHDGDPLAVAALSGAGKRYEYSTRKARFPGLQI